MADLGKVIMPALAIAATALLGVAIAALIFHVVPVENREIVSLLCGGLVNLATTSFGFYFGSSRSSQAKDETVAALSRQVQR